MQCIVLFVEQTNSSCLVNSSTRQQHLEDHLRCNGSRSWPCSCGTIAHLPGV
jgi:hypothetical protein